MIRVDGLTKRYGGLVALREFSLDMPSGRIAALVGPNGAGKTTALQLVVGLLRPDTGRVEVCGFDVHRQGLEAKRVLAFLPDQPFLYEQLTVAELLGFVSGMYRLAPDRLATRSAMLLQQFGMQAHLGRRIGQLSYGMKSRLALVASLLRDPKVLVMDEPFFGLDPQSLRSVKRLLREETAAGLTVLLSTHQLEVVEDLADWIVILDQGSMLAAGTLADFRSRYGDAHLEDVFFRLTGQAQTS